MNKYLAALLFCFATAQLAMAEVEPIIIETYDKHNRLVVDTANRLGLSLHSEDIHSLALSNFESGYHEILQGDVVAYFDYANAVITMDVTTSPWAAATAVMKSGENPVEDQIGVINYKDYSAYNRSLRCKMVAELSYDASLSEKTVILFTKIDCKKIE